MDSDTPTPSHIIDTNNSGSGFESLPSNSWPSPRFDTANTGYTPAQPPISSPVIRWQTSVSAPPIEDASMDATQPVVANKSVYTATQDGLFSLSLRDGTQQWQQDLKPVTYSSIWGYGDILLPPTVADQRLFLPTTNGLVGVDARDGSIVWRDTELQATGTPTVTNSSLFVPADGTLLMIDPSDGSRQWSEQVDATMPALVDGTVVTVGDEVVAMDATTGERRWGRPVSGDTYPVVVDGTVYTGTRDGLIGRSLSDGTEQWRIDRGRFSLPPVVTPDTIYAVEQVPEGSEATFAFTRSDDGSPEPRWCSDVGDGAVWAAADDAVLGFHSGEYDGDVSPGLVMFTAQFGEAAWGYPSEVSPAPPAVLDNAIVSVSGDGVITALGGE